LFIGIISAHTEARDEGYFQREYKLAVDRTHDMDEHKAFLVPVVIDTTSERGAHVPDYMINPDYERFAAKRMRAKVLALPTSHVPMLSKPKEVAAFIAAAANGIH
jgi:hypothetical protein